MAAEQPSNETKTDPAQLELDFSVRRLSAIAERVPSVAAGGDVAKEEASSFPLMGVVAVCGLVLVAAGLLWWRAHKVADRSKQARVLGVIPARVDTKALVAKTATQAVENPRAVLPRVRFVRVESASSYRANRNSPPLPKVLANFAVERDGDSMQVFDDDGAVYSGSASSNSVVHVSGFNRRLNQKVSFTGIMTNDAAMSGHVWIGKLAEFEMRAVRVK